MIFFNELTYVYLLFKIFGVFRGQALQLDGLQSSKVIFISTLCFEPKAPMTHNQWIFSTFQVGSGIDREPLHSLSAYLFLCIPHLEESRDEWHPAG